MAGLVKKIVIGTEEIEVLNDLNRIIQLGIEPTEEDINSIFENYNLSTLIHYPCDIKIIMALAENEDQIKDYLETCRKAGYSNEKVKVPDIIPEIEYDYRNLKNSDYDMQKKLEFYRQAKETKNVFRGARGRVTIRMSLIDKAYMEVQGFLKVKDTVLALNTAESASFSKKKV